MMMMKLAQRAEAMFPGAPAVRIPAQKLQISEEHGDYEADVVSVAELLFCSSPFVLSIIELHRFDVTQRGSMFLERRLPVALCSYLLLCWLISPPALVSAPRTGDGTSAQSFCLRETCLCGPAGFTEPGSVVPVSSSTREALNSLDRVVFLTESWSIDRRSTWVSVVFNRLSLQWPQFGKQVTSSSSSVSSIRLYSHGGRPHWLFTVFSVKNRIFVSSPHWKLEDIHSMIVNIWCSLKYLPDKLI